YLDRRHSGGAPGDCPLPELFAAVVRQHPALSGSAFHEGLRRLHDRRALRLQPAASLAALPHPEYALLHRAALLSYAARGSRLRRACFLRELIRASLAANPGPPPRR